MDHRHAIAYFFLLLIVVGVGYAWWRASAYGRSHRRASRDFERLRRARRAEEIERGD